MKTTLAALISPNTKLTNEAFVVHHDSQQLNELTSLPFLASLKVLLGEWKGMIEAHCAIIQDEISSVDVPSSEAQKHFDLGQSLLFNDAQNLSPVLQKWIDELRVDMGLSALTYGRCLIYATPDGQGTAPHFDQNINFVLQIHGTKKWKVAGNLHIQNPLTRHTIGQPTDPELASYLKKPMPVSMPENFKEFELKPGSLLFVPRGAWHCTEARGDALSLNFTFTAPTWIDLLTAALRSRLAQSAEWRETADVHSDKRFNALLRNLISDLPYWKAEDILGATES